MGYEKKPKGLIRVIQSQEFTIYFAKLGFSQMKIFLFYKVRNTSAALWQTVELNALLPYKGNN